MYGTKQFCILKHIQWNKTTTNSDGSKSKLLLQRLKLRKLKLNNRGCANASPSTTNYDVGSTTRVDLRTTPLLCAIKVTALGHEPSWSLIDPIQVSMIFNATTISFIAHTL